MKALRIYYTPYPRPLLWSYNFRHTTSNVANCIFYIRIVFISTLVCVYITKRKYTSFAGENKRTPITCTKHKEHETPNVNIGACAYLLECCRYSFFHRLIPGKLVVRHHMQSMILLDRRQVRDFSRTRSLDTTMLVLNVYKLIEIVRIVESVFPVTAM